MLDMQEYERAFGEMPEETRQRIRNTLGALPERTGSKLGDKRGVGRAAGGHGAHAIRWVAASAAVLLVAFGTLCAVNPDVAMAVPVVRDLFRLITKAGVEGFENLPELESDGTFTVQRIEREVKLPSGSTITIGEAFFDGRVVNISYHYVPFAVRPAVNLSMDVAVDGDDRGGERRGTGTAAADEAIRTYMKAAGLPEGAFTELKQSPWLNREDTGYVRVEITPEDLSKKSVSLNLRLYEMQPLPEEALGGMKVDGSTRLDRVMSLAQDPRDVAMKIDREGGPVNGDDSALSRVSMTSIPIGADAEIPIAVSMALPKGTTFAQKTVDVDAVRLEIACTRTPMRTYVRVRSTEISADSKAGGVAASLKDFDGRSLLSTLWIADEKGNPIETEATGYGDDVAYVNQMDYPSKSYAGKALYLHYTVEQDGKRVDRCEPIPLP